MKKIIQTVLTVLCVGGLTTPLLADYSLAKYANEVPGIGLITDSIEFDGIKISNFSFENDKKFIFVHPKQEFVARLHYQIDETALKDLNRHHLIIGLYNDGPQGCVLHYTGIKEKEGDACMGLHAPKKKGVYQVRFCHTVGFTDAQAEKAWWQGNGPSAKTIVGIVVVE